MHGGCKELNHFVTIRKALRWCVHVFKFDINTKMQKPSFECCI